MMRSSIPLLLSSFISSSSAFSTTSGRHHRIAFAQNRFSTLPLSVGVALDWNAEEDESFLMKIAQDCAFSDSCSLEDAQVSLDNVIHIQSNCASGMLVGSDVCENADTAAEIVASLREKITEKSKELRALKFGTTVVNVSVVLLCLSAFIAGTVPSNPDVSPFTPQEWWWAIRDGYFPNMLNHYYRNGGLATLDYNPETTPFTLQEWWWAMKGGYLSTMVDHFSRNGGMATAADYQVAAAAPITPGEWLWAARGGYFYLLFFQNFQNGGLADVASDTDILPMTLQEWIWSIRGGYFGDAVNHCIHNGGL